MFTNACKKTCSLLWAGTRLIWRSSMTWALMTTGFHIWPLATAYPYLIVPPGHRLATQKSVSICEIDGEDFVLFDAPRSREYFLGVFARFDIAPNIAFRSSSIESVRCNVANGLGVSLLSMKPAENATYEGGQVVPIKLDEELPPTHIVIASHVGSPAELFGWSVRDLLSGFVWGTRQANWLARSRLLKSEPATSVVPTPS